MSGKALFALALVTALGCGTVGGMFYAFSTFVMQALARLPAPTGIVAMQSINLAVYNPAFMTAFMGTAVACLATGVAAWFLWGHPGTAWLLAGSLLYLAGTFLLTIVLHVPMNEALAPLDPQSVEAATAWTGYVPDWTAWNHVRTAASLAAMLSFMVALVKTA